MQPYHGCLCCRRLFSAIALGNAYKNAVKRRYWCSLIVCVMIMIQVERMHRAEKFWRNVDGEDMGLVSRGQRIGCAAVFQGLGIIARCVYAGMFCACFMKVLADALPVCSNCQYFPSDDSCMGRPDCVVSGSVFPPCIRSVRCRVTLHALHTYASIHVHVCKESISLSLQLFKPSLKLLNIFVTCI